MTYRIWNPSFNSDLRKICYGSSALDVVVFPLGKRRSPGKYVSSQIVIHGTDLCFYMPHQNQGDSGRAAVREVLLTFISIDKSKPGALPGQRIQIKDIINIIAAMYFKNLYIQALQFLHH